MSLFVLSVGGSIISPSNVDTSFLASFRLSIESYLEKDPSRRLIIVTGGGSVAREYQRAHKELCGEDKEIEDLLGIKATYINAELVKSIFPSYVLDDVVHNPTKDGAFKGRILVASGWKPGFSTDTDAVYLALRFNAKTVINLSNTKMVYTEDPRKNKDAKPIERISWDEFISMVGNEWKPGLNAPFDPVASVLARDNGISTICADGRDIENTINILEGKKYIGTLIS